MAKGLALTVDLPGLTSNGDSYSSSSSELSIIRSQLVCRKDGFCKSGITSVNTRTKCGSGTSHGDFRVDSGRGSVDRGWSLVDSGQVAVNSGWGLMGSGQGSVDSGRGLVDIG